uniref:protein-tyrosine-phosphatase n=1 Tax=Diabrotica virgifera virgifera TaxID=50390 RepID=A0A6P7H4K6_DIAVI
MQETSFGWIIAGPYSTRNNSAGNGTTKCNFANTREVTEQLSKFWELEEVCSEKPAFSSEEVACEKHFANTVKRDAAGKFIVRKVKILPQEFHYLIQPDPSLEQTEPEPNVYRCKKCRRILAAESNLLLHESNGVVCKETYFVEPIAWMNVLQENQGKILCPKCSTKLGSFSWIMGCQCPCGIQVAPAFYLTPSKVDFCNVVKNLETTC